MFSKASCVGRLCPSSLEEINMSHFVNRVILVPYVLTEKGYYVQTFKGELLKSECGNQSPFICGEEALEKYNIQSRDITHIFFVGHAKPEEMLIFIKLDKKTGNGFVKVTPTMNAEYSWQIKYVLGSEIERFVLKGKDVTMHHILTRLEGSDLVNFCKTSHSQEECNKYVTLLIENKMGKDFLKGKPKHVKIVDLYSILYACKFKLDKSLEEAAKRNEISILNFLFPKVQKERREKIVVLGAIKGNHLELIKLFIKKGFKDGDYGLEKSALEGNKNLVEFFLQEIKKSGKLTPWKFDRGMAASAEGGHKDLVEFFIEKGASDWGWGMSGSTRGGHKNLVDFFIEKGADDWDVGLEDAAYGGHKDLVEFFISKGANNFETGLEKAIEGGQINLVKFFVEEKGVNNIENGLQLSTFACKPKLAYYFIGRGAHDWDSALESTTEIDCKELYDFFTRKIAERDAPQEVPEEEPGEEPGEERILPRMGWLEQ